MSKPSERQEGGSHYKSLPIQPIHYIRKNGLGWYEGNIVKYVTRHSAKGRVEDIKKVIHYAELLLEEYEDEQRQRDGTTGDGPEPSDGPTDSG